MSMPSNAFASLVVVDPSLASKGLSPLSIQQRCVMLDHFDWADRPSSYDHRGSTTSSSSSSLISVSEVSSDSTDHAGLLPMKKDRVSSTVTPKVHSFVGQSANAIGERGVLRKKFSWRQFPEVRSFRLCCKSSLEYYIFIIFSVEAIGFMVDERGSLARRRSARVHRLFLSIAHVANSLVLLTNFRFFPRRTLVATMLLMWRVSPNQFILLLSSSFPIAGGISSSTSRRVL